MITIFGFTAPWPLWVLLAVAAAALAVLAGYELARRVRWARYEWCETCEVWCHEVNDPCECCELPLDDERQADELEPIGEYDDGEPVTGELRAVDDDDAWTAELAELNRARRAGELDELERVPTSIFAALSDDPDVIAWDLRQQAARAWDIAHVEFPKLRAELAREYAAAAAPKPWPLTSWETAA